MAQRLTKPKKKTAKRRPVKKAAKKAAKPQMTWDAIAKALDISLRNLHKMRKIEGAPAESRDSGEWADWIASREAAGGHGTGRITLGGKTFTAADIMDLKGHLVKAQGEGEVLKNKIREFDLRVKEEGLVPIDEAKAAIAKVLVPLVAQLDSLPSSYAVKANPSAPEIAEAAIREGVHHLKQMIQRAQK
jgi:hypothetical protein